MAFILDEILEHLPRYQSYVIKLNVRRHPTLLRSTFARMSERPQFSAALLIIIKHIEHQVALKNKCEPDSPGVQKCRVIFFARAAGQHPCFGSNYKTEQNLHELKHVCARVSPYCKFLRGLPDDLLVVGAE